MKNDESTHARNNGSLDLSPKYAELLTELKGLSPCNLRYMRTFAETYHDELFLQQAAAKLPWSHNVRILDYVRDPAEREFYIRKTIEYGWSRNVLVHQIESDLYHRQDKAIANFDRTLPAPQSELALQILKDPYNFDSCVNSC